MSNKIKAVAIARHVTDIPIIHKALRKHCKRNPGKEEELDVTIVMNTKGRRKS